MFEQMDFSQLVCMTCPWRRNNFECHQDIHSSELVSLQLPCLEQCAKATSIFSSTFEALFLIKKSRLRDLLLCRDLEITYQNKAVYNLHNCCLCIADRGEQQDTSQWKQPSLIRSVVECVCVAQQILSMGTMKSFFFVFSLHGFCCLLHMIISVKTTWPAGSVIRY